MSRGGAQQSEEWGITHGVVGVFDEGVNRKQRQVRLTLGIVDEIEVDQFLQLKVICDDEMRNKAQGRASIRRALTSLNAIDHIREESGDILANGHISDDLISSRPPRSKEGM